MYNRVLLYLDYSEGALAAAEVALRVAERYEAELLVLTAPPLPPPFPYQNPYS